MSNQKSFFRFFEEFAEKINSYLFDYYQNSQKIKEKILSCRTVVELTNLCLSLDNSSEKIEIKWLFTDSPLSAIKTSSDLSNYFLIYLKVLVEPMYLESLISFILLENSEKYLEQDSEYINLILNCLQKRTNSTLTLEQLKIAKLSIVELVQDKEKDLTFSDLVKAWEGSPALGEFANAINKCFLL